MALLNRFRTQSRPQAPRRRRPLAVRPGDSARRARPPARESRSEDPDPRVRRAAVAKLMDPAALATVARERCRRAGARAGARRCCATSRSKRSRGSAKPRASRRSRAIEEPKALVGVAKNASREATATAALASRHRPRTRLARSRATPEHEGGAPRRVRAPARSRRDAERRAEQRVQGSGAGRGGAIIDRAELEQIAARARNKSASKRARALVREQDERVARGGGGGSRRGRRRAAAVRRRPSRPSPAGRRRRSQDHAERQAAARRSKTPTRRSRAAGARGARAPSRPHLELCERIEKLQGERALERTRSRRPPSGKGMPALDDQAAHDELTRRFERAARDVPEAPRRVEGHRAPARRGSRELADEAGRAAALEDLAGRAASSSPRSAANGATWAPA